jgi:hypothetical protein
VPAIARQIGVLEDVLVRAHCRAQPPRPRTGTQRGRCFELSSAPHWRLTVRSGPDLARPNDPRRMGDAPDRTIVTDALQQDSMMLSLRRLMASARTFQRVASHRPDRGRPQMRNVTVPPGGIAHIEPGRRSKASFHEPHRACPTCHTRYDCGDIDRKAMKQARPTSVS